MQTLRTADRHGRRAGKAMKHRLRVLRPERGGGQAGRLDVSRQSVHAIETGRYRARLPLALAIARLSGLPVDAIVTPDRENA